ncbi:MAG: gluconokinase [Anaerolineae bacterium]|nr:gluconokinase [Anaerolineae bacterium]
MIMGVSGCGKTTIGQALADRLDCPFYDGDHFHPPQNVAKMAGGQPLTDEDRRPWLARLHQMMAEHEAKGETAVFACSALKKRYRDQLRDRLTAVQFIHLQGNFDLIWGRMQARQGHYMKAPMLQSQFDALESPGPDEAITISAAEDVETILELIQKQSKEC